ncbi:MAG: TRAP transporter large permease subunit [Alphaproteobacteria bacterium]
MIWSDPAWYEAFAVLMALVCVPMFLGIPVVFAFFFANIVGVFLFKGGHIGLVQMPAEFVEALARYSYVAVPLFVLMGEILFHTGLAFRAINAIDRLISRVPGRLSVVSIAGGTVFASLSGSTIGNTALLGSVLLPDMIKRGYDPKIAMGPIMAVGGIAMLIPPSSLAVLLASLAEKPVKELLIAGIVPGLMMAGLFVSYVVMRCYLNPKLAPAHDDEAPTGSRWGPFFRNVLPLMSIFVVVVGSILLEVASPEDSAALGCVAALLAAICYRAASRSNVMKALIETAKINVMILFVIAGSLTFTQLLGISGALDGLLGQIEQYKFTQIEALLLMMAILLFLGMFMDQISMILLTLPVFLKMAEAIQIPDLWLLILILIAMEVSLLTPPFGLLLFVMKGVAPPKTTFTTIIAAAVPYVTIEIFVMFLIVVFPILAIGLPSLLR